MAFYEPLVAEGFEWINAVADADYERFVEFDGRPRRSNWQPVLVRRVRADKQQAFNASDFPWLGAHALVMRESAVRSLREILDQNGEVLPLATEDSVPLFVFNARCIDALDEAHSSIIRIPGTDRIMLMKSVAFIPAAVDGVDIFRLGHRGSSTYVSDRFVERVRAEGLRGLTFKRVWSSPGEHN